MYETDKASNGFVFPVWVLAFAFLSASILAWENSRHLQRHHCFSPEMTTDVEIT